METAQKQELNKSIDSLIDSYFSKASENFEVAPAAKTTADAVMSEAPGSEDDASRGAGRPKDDHDVPKTDEDGNKAKGYEAVQEKKSEEENPEAKQAGDVSQISSEGRIGGDKPKMKDPRISKADETEYEEFLAFKKAKKEKDELKKSEDIKKAQSALIKAEVEAVIAPVRKENEELKKAVKEQTALLKAIASQPQRPKSITGIDALVKAEDPDLTGPKEYTRKDKLDAAESLVMKKALPADAVIELENTGTVYNPAWRKLIEQELEKQN